TGRKPGMAPTVHALAPETASRKTKPYHETPKVWVERRLSARSPVVTNHLVCAGRVLHPGERSRPVRGPHGKSPRHLPATVRRNAPADLHGCSVQAGAGGRGTGVAAFAGHAASRGSSLPA